MGSADLRASHGSAALQAGPPPTIPRAPGGDADTLEIRAGTRRTGLALRPLAAAPFSPLPGGEGDAGSRRQAQRPNPVSRWVPKPIHRPLGPTEGHHTRKD